MNFTDRPCAAEGLMSYRFKHKFGFVMIGATNDADAINEARRSTDNPGQLQRWNDRLGKYVTL